MAWGFGKSDRATSFSADSCRELGRHVGTGLSDEVEDRLAHLIDVFDAEPTPDLRFAIWVSEASLFAAVASHMRPTGNHFEWFFEGFWPAVQSQLITAPLPAERVRTFPQDVERFVDSLRDLIPMEGTPGALRVGRLLVSHYADAGLVLDPGLASSWAPFAIQFGHNVVALATLFNTMIGSRGSGSATS
jgi:hypothetical protein